MEKLISKFQRRSSREDLGLSTGEGGWTLGGYHDPNLASVMFLLLLNVELSG